MRDGGSSSRSKGRQAEADPEPTPHHVRNLGPYVTRSPVGRGAGTLVYRARHQASGGHVALKVWTGPLDHPARRRFARECLLHWRLLDHPSVVRMHTSSRVDEPVLWLAQDLYRSSLAQRLRLGPLSSVEARRTALGLLDGLAAMHALGVLHRDVNPCNVLLHHDRAVLGDLGSADWILRPGTDPAEGTSHYVAPELRLGAAPDMSTDLYSAAVTILELVGGRAPAGWRDALHTAAASDRAARGISVDELRHVVATGWDAPDVLDLGALEAAVRI